MSFDKCIKHNKNKSFINDKKYIKTLGLSMVLLCLKALISCTEWKMYATAIEQDPFFSLLL